MLLLSKKKLKIILTNPSGITQQLEARVSLGHSSEVEIVPYASLIFEMDDTGKIAQGGGNNKEADYVTSVLTIKTLDVDSQKENLVNYFQKKELHSSGKTRISCYRFCLMRQKGRL